MIDQNLISTYPRKKETKIVMQREITTYLHRSLPLCILLAYENYRPWYYCNYIQIFSYENEEGFIELNYLEPRDSFAEVLDLTTLGFHLLKNEQNILDFIKDKINLGYSLVVHLDEYELKNKSEYKKNHFVHSSLIYGYDDDTQKVSAIGFNKDKAFIELEFSYDELYKSYESGKLHYADTAPWYEWSAIQLIKPRELKHPFIFSMDKFMRDFKSYIYSISDTYRLYSFGYPEDRIKYGIDVYDVFISSMRKILQGDGAFDYRAYHFFSEHKKCLYDRINYIIEKYQLTGEIIEKNKAFMKVVEKLIQLRLKYLKQTIVSSCNDNPTKEQLSMIQEAACEVEQLKSQEFSIMEDIFNILKVVNANEILLK